MTTGSTAIDEYRRLIKAREAIDAAIEACVQKAEDVKGFLGPYCRNLDADLEVRTQRGSPNHDSFADLLRNAEAVIADHGAQVNSADAIVQHHIALLENDLGPDWRSRLDEIEPAESPKLDVVA